MKIARMDIDRSDCPLVMQDREGGDWLVMVSQPRVPVEGLLANYLDGESVAEVAAMFEVDVTEVGAIIRYAVERS